MKIFVIIGKSSTGKDTIYKKLLNDKRVKLQGITTYTTRPIRSGEKDGVEYYFKDIKDFEKQQREGKIIEYREYNTNKGLWIYYMVNDGQIDIKSNNKYLIIGTLETLNSLRKIFGKNVVPIYIEVNNNSRFIRAYNREQKQLNPNYDELYRRFLADNIDFSETNLKAAKINKKYINNELNNCVNEIISNIKKIK